MSKWNARDIKLDDFMLGQYLFENRNTNLSKVMFSVRSTTFDIKVWQQWKYEDNLCILCQVKEKNMDHFVICSSYSNQSSNIIWKDMLWNNVDRNCSILIWKTDAERWGYDFAEGWPALESWLRSSSKLVYCWAVLLVTFWNKIS